MRLAEDGARMGGIEFQLYPSITMFHDYFAEVTIPTVHFRHLKHSYLVSNKLTINILTFGSNRLIFSIKETQVKDFNFKHKNFLKTVAGTLCKNLQF